MNVYAWSVDSRKSDSVINAYMAHRLDEILAPKGPFTTRQLDEKTGVSHATLSDIKKGKKGVGTNVLLKLVDYFGMSLDEFRRAAEEWRRLNPPETLEAPVNEGPVVELDARYPNAARAAVLAREEGVADDAIEAVLQDSLKSLGDLPMSEWLRQMVDRAAFFAKMRAQTPAQKQAEVDDSRQLVSDLEQQAEEIRKQNRAAREAAKQGG
jgi:transcriptional regulator with XRE-family HTH domain